MNKFSYKIAVRKDRELRTGEYPLCLLLIYCRRNRRISLNISIKKQHWDERSQIVKKGDPESDRKNKLLTIYKNRIAGYETECIIKNKPIILDDAIRLLNGSPVDEHSFYDYIKKEWPNFEASLKSNTLKKYKSQLKVLKSFKKKLYFSDIDSAFLRSYETYLTNVRHNCKNTRGKALKWIKTIINQAIRDEIIETSPFRKYKISTEPGNREHLTMKEISRLKKLYDSFILPANMQETLRAFLFCCYTGLRLGDMKALLYKNINEGILTILMHKTDLPVLIPLAAMAKSLVSEKKEYCVFHPVSDQMINKHLKKIMIIAKIDKKITFHCSRHTFATVSLNLGIPKDTVQKILGHTDIKTTDIYTQYEVSLLQKEMRKWDKS